MAKGTFGERLKRERELREVTQDEIVAATRISPRFLDALENEKWNQLPGGVFGRGFVRSIARYLGLNEENLLAEYDLARSENSPPQVSKPEQRIPSPPKWIPALMILGILVLIAALVFAAIYGWRKFQEHRRAKQQQQQSALIPAPAAQNPANSAAIQTTPVSLNPESTPSSASTSASAPPTQMLDLSLAASASTRIRVLGDGSLLADAELPAGETRHFNAKDHFEVTAANSSAVLLELNGQTMPPLGAPNSSGTMVLGWKDLRQASGGTTQP